MNKQSDKKAGFTLIELLVIIGIIAIVAGIIFPVIARVRAKARQANCASNLHQLGMASLIYTQDYDDYFPPFSNMISNTALGCNIGLDRFYDPYLLHAALMPYIKNQDIWFCPSDPFAGTNTDVWLINHYYTSYKFYFVYSSGSIASVNKGLGSTSTSFTPLIGDPNSWYLTSPSDRYNGPCGYLGPPSGGNHFDGTNACYIDGHVKWAPPFYQH